MTWTPRRSPPAWMFQFPKSPLSAWTVSFFSSCGQNVGPFGPLLEHCISYYE